MDQNKKHKIINISYDALRVTTIPNWGGRE